MFRTSARRWSDILLRKKRMSAGGRGGGPARRDAAVSRFNPLLRYYRIILRRGPRNVGSLPLPATIAIPFGHA